MPPKLHRLHPKSLFSTSSIHTSIILPSISITSPLRQPPFSSSKVASASNISSLQRPPPLYPGHIPINLPERFFLALGSTLYSFFSPRRPDLIALCSETTTPISLLRSLRDVMLSHPSGRRILRERPRISTTTVDVTHLRTLPLGTLGRTYVDWLDTEHVTPDTRDPVRHIPEEELAYVLQRYRESHDLYHVLLAEKGMPSFLEGEVVVKGFEFAALGLPMTGLAALSAFKLPREQRKRVLWGGKGGAGDTTGFDTTFENEDTAPSSSSYQDAEPLPESYPHRNSSLPSSPASSSTSQSISSGTGQPWLAWAISQGVSTRSSSMKSLLNVYWENEWETPLSELRERLGIRLPPGVGDLRLIRKAAREERRRRRKGGREMKGDAKA